MKVPAATFSWIEKELRAIGEVKPPTSHRTVFCGIENHLWRAGSEHRYLWYKQCSYYEGPAAGNTRIAPPT